MKVRMVATVALVAGCAVGAVAREVVVPARAHNSNGPTYEYRVVKPGSISEAEDLLARFGAKGWRLAQMTTHVMVFERERASGPRPDSEQE